MTNEQTSALAAWLRDTAELNRKLADALSSATPATAKRGVLIPTYFAPSSPLWNLVIAASASLDVIAIANPASGPGTAKSTAYVDLIARVTDFRVKVIGYVATGYGKRAAKDVLTDIDRWYAFYPAIAGIFFDQQATDAAHLPLYSSYFAAVHAHHGYVASNPGAACDEGYASQAKADCLVLWERAAAAGTPTLPAWARAAALSCAALVHDAHAGDAAALVPKMRDAGFARVFVTTDVAPNPWDSLGSDFDPFVAAAAKG